MKKKKRKKTVKKVIDIDTNLNPLEGLVYPTSIKTGYIKRVKKEQMYS